MKAEESSIPAGDRFLPGNTAESMRRKQLERPIPRRPRASFPPEALILYRYCNRS